ncbi:MAG: hypothetical protein QME94_08210, partial [Anaerolineae bacterium]|nr:hypothetical protein [Anaerolineae bacterium]
PPEAPAPATEPAPTRRIARGVESYWMAAERLGVPRGEAERILQDAHGDWGEAWRVLRTLEQTSPTA